MLQFWKEQRIFEVSQEGMDPQAPHFVFYEGPPTANGLPHNGHVLTRVMKDLFPRYRAMCGDRVLRKAGWDTHGLPVEVEVEKELHIHGKSAIEEFGVRPFVARCLQSVFRYTSEWERLTERIGFWVSLPEAYVTFHKSYVESVWWALSELFKRGLLYQGHKVVWWWAQGGTALSSAEVGLGYKTVDDPSIYVCFPLVEQPDTALVVWTTTPWTLPANQYAAVRAECVYDQVRLGGRLAGAQREPPALDVSHLIVAQPLRAELEQKLGQQLIVERSFPGSELVGQRYQPPFDWFTQRLWDRKLVRSDGTSEPFAWRVIAEDFVTLDTGTGIVHIAPAFGEDDHRAHQRQTRDCVEPELLCPVLPDGTFGPEADPKYQGRWVKHADRDVIRDLSASRRLVLEETVRHEYPYCWRADADPLIQMARPAWFIRTTARLQEVLRNNQGIHWLPEHIRDGRFGDFLANNVDWALSRERYWGTPLNVWICSANPEHRLAPASVAEIQRLNPRAFDAWERAVESEPSLPSHLQVHKPWIDEVTFPCPECGASMRRVPEVIDCWFDSGCMPFAQWGFPHLPGSIQQFQDSFPATFISEAIDQTRGWFYSLLMVSTLLFDPETQRRLGWQEPRAYPHPYQSCIVLGHVCDRDGKKESKSRGNYTPPEIILDRVALDFAVVCDVSQAKPAIDTRGLVPGVVLVAAEDRDGMDLVEGAKIRVTRPDRPSVALTLEIRQAKNLPRRIALLAPEDRERLGVVPAGSGLSTLPVEVPRLADEQRVRIEDPTMPAPGADAFRWFFYAASPPSSNTRHSLRNVRTLQKDFLVKLRNVYSFFTIYANIDGWSPARAEHAGRPFDQRALLDRWVLSELELAIGEVRGALDGFGVYEAAQRLLELVEGISNWYVRRSRERFWAPGLDADKRDAFATLYEVLVTTARLIAPFTPFFAEEIYQNLVVGAGVPGSRLSVHLERYPEVDSSRIDQRLAVAMQAVREVVRLGLSVRTTQKIKVRQPLSKADLIFNDLELLEAVRPHLGLIAEELNVKAVELMDQSQAQAAIQFRIKPNFKTLGRRLGKLMKALQSELAARPGGPLVAELAQRGKLTVTVQGEAVTLERDDLEIAIEATPGFAAETGRVGVVVLHTTLTEQLIDDGLLRELLSRIQAARKDRKLDFVAKTRLCLDGSERLMRVARQNQATLMSETLAETIEYSPLDPSLNQAVGEETLRLVLEQA